MDNIVKRAEQSPLVGDEIITRHQGDHLVVTSHLQVGIRPCIRLHWSIEPLLPEGGTLVAFRSTTGFCADEDPADLTQHGQMFLETRHDGEQSLHLPEGNHFFVFIVRRHPWHGLWEQRSKPLRFHVSIPSANIVIKRVEDEIKLKDLVQELSLQAVRHEIVNYI